MSLLKEVKTQRIFAYREYDKQRKTRRQTSTIQELRLQKNELLTGDSCFGRKITPWVCGQRPVSHAPTIWPHTLAHLGGELQKTRH